MTRQLLLWTALCTVLAISCEKDDQAPPSNTLAAYIDDNPQWTPHNELVACAAGGQSGFLDDRSLPLSMFFYPKLYSTNFRYYEMIGEGDTADLSQYVESSAAWEPLFNGFMARYPLSSRSDTWARVSYVSNDTLWYCKPVRYKMDEDPTNFNPELLEVSFSAGQPSFSWPAEDDSDNIIYFQILADARGDAVSATYTTDKFFRYYDLSNVVFNVTRPGPVLDLDPGDRYSMILMGIGADNWVNTISRVEFQAPDQE